jgi:HlyD family secretion protein
LKKIIIRVLLIAIVLGGAWWGYGFMKQMPKAQQEIATTPVRRGDVIVRSYARGELRATRSITLTAPNLFGTVQVTRLAPLGSFAHEKDLIVEFDDSEVNSRIEEKQLELDQIDEQIKKAEADLAVRNNQDQVDLLTAKFGVRRSELEVKRNELLSAIDAKKNLLSLEEAKRRLQQLESDIQSRQAQSQAEIAVFREKKNKGLLEMQREKARLSQVKLLSPMTGLVAIKQNRPNFFFPGMQIPDIREGDQLNPGIAVADVLDLSELEVLARVGEMDRANLREGQDVSIQLDAIPGKNINGKIKNMSGTATSNVFSSDPAKKFDVVFSLDMRQLFATLGVKPGRIQQILALAEQNRKKSGTAEPPPMPAMMMAGAPPPAPPVGGSQQPAGTAGAQSSFRMSIGPNGPGAPGGASSMIMAGPGGAPAADMQKKVNDALQKALGGKKMQDLSPEERQKVMAQVQAALQGGKPDAGPNGAGPGGPPTMMGFGGAQQFSEKELANAQLPPPPEENSQFEVLLRPGLLADVEIIVEKIPNAIHIPTQAVFEREGKLVAYVKNGNRFEERAFTPLKRSESTIVVDKGLRPGEVVALADPNAKKGDKKKGKSGDGAMGALPGGGAK